MNYSVEFCEREYNARASIPEHPQIFARWAERAAATRRLRACLLDLQYGESTGERLDLFPARHDGAPLLVFIHGGYWRALDKSDFSWIAPPFVNHDVSVALLNYGLAPHTPLEEIVRQMLRAHAWLYRNADQYGYDPARMHVCGHSAGGHLTAMMLAALWPVFAPDLPADLIKSGLAISGLFDLEPLIYAPFVNADLQLDQARAHKLSPARMPAPASARLLTSVGEQESGEFHRQARVIAKAWRANFVRAVPARGSNHLTVCDELANPGSALFDAALQMTRR